MERRQGCVLRETELVLDGMEELVLLVDGELVLDESVVVEGTAEVDGVIGTPR